EVAVEERAGFGLPTEGQWFRRRAETTRQPELGRGGVVPRPFRMIHQEPRVPFACRLEVAEASPSRLQRELHGGIAGVEWAKRGQSRLDLEAAFIPLPRIDQAAEQNELADFVPFWTAAHSSLRPGKCPIGLPEAQLCGDQ